jgi:hypothetical protein
MALNSSEKERTKNKHAGRLAKFSVGKQKQKFPDVRKEEFRRSPKAFTRLVGNVDVLQYERVDDRFGELNKQFLSACRAFGESGQSLRPLLRQYRSAVKKILGDKAPSGGFSFSLKRTLGDLRPVEDLAGLYGEGGLKAAGSPISMQNHVCSQGEVYRFLVHHFDVVCPNKNFNNEFVESMEALREMERLAEFPFREPPEYIEGCNVLASMTKREDVGDHNRKIFEAITERFKDKNELRYIRNPDFYEDSSEEDEASAVKCLMRENVACAYYHNGRYKTVQNLVLRMFSEEGRVYVNIRQNKNHIFRELDASQAKFVYNKGEEVMHLMMMKTMVIHKIILRHPYVARKLYEQLTV